MGRGAKKHVFGCVANILVLSFACLCQEQDECLRPGECLGGNFEGSTFTKNYNKCLDFCSTVEKCQYINYYGDVERCVTVNSCPLFSNATCYNCYSGQRKCPYQIECHQNAHCEGIIIKM